MGAGREHHVTPHPRAALRYREAPPGRELRAAVAVYRRVRRFRRLLDACDGPCAGSWADAAAAVGYFDQAHMTREFERLAGISPRAWRAEQADVGFVQEARLTVR